MTVTNEDLLEKANEILEQGDQILEAIAGKWVPPVDVPEPPLPNTRTVTMLKKAPLRELKRHNKKGKMVLRIHGGLQNRIKAIAGEELIVVVDRIKVDGSRNYAYRLAPEQPVNGKALPPKSNSTAKHPVTKAYDKDFFILARHVE